MPATGPLILATLPIVGTVLGWYFERAAIYGGPAGGLPDIVKSCSSSFRRSLPTDISGGKLPKLDNLLCALMEFFKVSVSTRLNVGLLAILASVLVPLLVRLSYQSVSPNRKTSLFSGIVFFTIISIGQLVGVGMAGISIGVLLYTRAHKKAFDRSSSAIPPVPTGAYSIYLCNLAAILTGILTGLMVFADTSTKLWIWAFVAFQLFPVLYLPVVIASFSTPKINTEQQAKEELRLWDAEGVSYSFERTWSYYRTWGGVSAILYWYGLNRIFRGVVYAGNKWDGASHFFLFDTLGTTGLLLSLVLLERLTVRSKAERHPISGSPRAALDVECDQVIAKAPAGSVWLEKTLTGFFVGSLVAGPGFAASMWWCSGEEELGWKSRKAWREAVAVDGKKNK